MIEAPKVACNWIHFCDYAFQDSGGKSCLLGVFDRIRVKRVPTTHSRCFIVAQIQGEPLTEAKLRVQIVRPADRGSTFDSTFSFRFGEDGLLGLQLVIEQLQLPDSGRYMLQLSVGPEVLKAVPLTVDSEGAGKH